MSMVQTCDYVMHVSQCHDNITDASYIHTMTMVGIMLKKWEGIIASMPSRIIEREKIANAL